MNRLLYFAAGVIIGKALTKTTTKTTKGGQGQNDTPLPQLVDLSDMPDKLWEQASATLPADVINLPSDFSVVSEDWKNVFQEA